MMMLDAPRVALPLPGAAMAVPAAAVVKLTRGKPDGELWPAVNPVLGIVGGVTLWWV